MKKSIINKIIAFFLGIIFLVIFSIVSYTKTSLIKSNEILINKNIIETTKSISLYLEQYFRYKNIDFNKVALSVEAPNISNDLGYRLDNNIYIYNTQGEVIYQNDDEKQELKNTEDLEKALNKKLSYTIDYKKDSVKVYVSYPIIKNDSLIGVIRYVSNLSNIFGVSKLLLNKIMIFSIIIFILSIGIAYFIATQLTKPIILLASKTKEIAKGNFDVEFEVSSEDELGRLSLDFKAMAEKIKEQIDVIEKDRDSLRELSEKQKKFFDNVTHELKTPMTTIIGYSEVIKENQFTDEEFFNKGIDRIISEASRLNRMIIQLLEISKKSESDFDYELKKIDMSAIIKGICEDMIHKAKKYNINIGYNIQENIKIIANEDKIKEVMINLIDNSIKYSKVNTKIKVEVFKEYNYVNIWVKDEGEGIEKDELDNILLPFCRVSKSETRELGSTGLGLAIVKSIIDSYNGEINIFSQVGVGTEVLLKLPTIN